MSKATAEIQHWLQHHIDEEHRKYFTFFNVSIALVLITAIELVIIYVPIHPVIVFGTIAILSIIKFLAVIWWFMHLRWDKVLCTGLFLVGLLIATGTVVALMFLFEADPNGPPVF